MTLSTMLGPTFLALQIVALMANAADPVTGLLPVVRDEPGLTLIQQFEATGVREQRSRCEKLQQERDETVKTLLKIAARKEKPTDQIVPYKRHAAISLLGKLECRAAIPFLIQHIELQDPFGGGGAFTGMNGFTCALALQEMRDAATYPIMTYLQATPPSMVSDQAIRLYSLVMLVRDRDRADDLVVLIQRVRDRAERKENLDRLLICVKQLRPGE